MYDDDDIDPAFLARYFGGECGREEARRFEQWIAERPGRDTFVDELRDAWRIAGEPPRESYDLEAAWTKVRPGARARPRLQLTTANPSRRRRGLTRRLALAASVVLAIAGSFTGYQLLRTRSTSLATAEPTVHTITTTPGQRISLRLADGTTVVVAPASTLRVPATYGARDRTVELTGEAVFTVEHDDRRPFTVRTPRLVAHDLGTRFIVRAYADDPADEVVVAEGEVEVYQAGDSADESTDSSPVLLMRGDGVRVASGGRPARMRDVSLDRYFSWTEGQLVFRRTLLGEAARQLERWYDIQIELESADLAQLGITASFAARQPVDEALDVVTAVLDLEALRTGPRNYTLTRRRQ